MTGPPKKLISKAQFARDCGVSAVAITKVSRTILKPAVYGKKIDAGHPAAVAYLKAKTAVKAPPPATGIDPLYEEAIELCEEKGRYTSRTIRDGLNIGTPRADVILAMMTAAGLVPEKGSIPKKPRKSRAKPKSPEIPTEPPPEPNKKKSRGLGALKENKKAESLAALAAEEIIPTEPAPAAPDIPDDISAFVDMTLRQVIQRFGTDAAFCDWLKATKDIELVREKRIKNAKDEGLLIGRHLVKIGIIDPIDAAHVSILTDGVKTMALRSAAMRDAGRSVDDIEAFLKDQFQSYIRPMKDRTMKALKNAG